MGKQRYKCNDCGAVFVLREDWREKAYKKYCLNGHSYRDIGQEQGKCARTIQRNFDKVRVRYFLKETQDKHINLCLDGVYFGWSLCYVVLRVKGQNIYFKKCSETIEHIRECLRDTEEMGYTYKSFTIDGRKGIIEMIEREYPGVPIQYCQFHQRQTIRRYLTKEPKTRCGQELSKFLRDITKYDRKEFIEGLQAIEDKYKTFLEERNEQHRYMHRKLRSAFRSLKKNLPYLFTYKEERYKHLNIPNTTNTCEGYFGHLKSKVRMHPGLIKRRKEKLIEKILLES